MLSVRDDVTKSTAMSEDVETAPSSEQRMTFRVEAAGPIGLGLKDRVYVDGSMVVVSSVDAGTPADLAQLFTFIPARRIALRTLSRRVSASSKVVMMCEVAHAFA